jgi:RNA polymerase sigma-54 factor
MALTPRLEFRQSQQLVMTPQLQQAIKLLQYSNIELAEFVADEIESNPLLENSSNEPPQGQRKSDEAGGDGREAPAESSPDGEMAASDQPFEGGGDVTAGSDAPLDADYGQNVFNNDTTEDAPPVGGGMLGYDGAGSIGGGGGFDGDGSFEQNISEHQNLQDYLGEQLKLSRLDQMDKLIASHLIEMVDEAGYIHDDLGELPERLGCDEGDVVRVLMVLQGMEPAGVCARTLAECLELQLKELDRFDPCMKILIENLDLLARQEHSKLKKLCEVDADDLIDMVQEVQALNPKPGLSYSGGEPVQPIVPDVYVRRNPAGVWTVELNTDTLPKVLVNGQYYAELTSLAGSKKDKAYVSECYSNANWLIKALDQRARTILKVATELVKQQEAFFALGVRHLKPLNLKAIADAIEMHESTVSRVTANKYLGTSRGILEMKYFFTSAIQSAYGADAHSAEAVRHRIKELIDGEDAKAILSDDKIVDLLRAAGIDIARRTVAKYRESMHIASSVQRRRQKNRVL